MKQIFFSAGSKVLCLMIFSSFLLSTRNTYFIGVLFVLVFSLAFSLAAWQHMRDRMMSLGGIMLFILCIHLFFGPADTFSERFLHGITAGAKLASLSIAVFLFTTTTSMSEILRLFSFFPQQMRLMLTICFGIMPVIMNETQKIKLAQSARGQTFRNLALQKSILPILIPLLHRTLQRAEQLTVVLASRGYRHGDVS